MLESQTPGTMSTAPLLALTRLCEPVPDPELAESAGASHLPLPVKDLEVTVRAYRDTFARRTATSTRLANISNCSMYCKKDPASSSPS